MGIYKGYNGIYPLVMTFTVRHGKIQPFLRTVWPIYFDKWAIEKPWRTVTVITRLGNLWQPGFSTWKILEGWDFRRYYQPYQILPAIGSSYATGSPQWWTPCFPAIDAAWFSYLWGSVKKIIWGWISCYRNYPITIWSIWLECYHPFENSPAMTSRVPFGYAFDSSLSHNS